MFMEDQFRTIKNANLKITTKATTSDNPYGTLLNISGTMIA